MNTTPVETIIASFTMPDKIKATAELFLMNKAIVTLRANARLAFASKTGDQATTSAQGGVAKWSIGCTYTKPRRMHARKAKHRGATTKVYENASNCLPTLVNKTA